MDFARAWEQAKRDVARAPLSHKRVWWANALIARRMRRYYGDCATDCSCFRCVLAAEDERRLERLG